MLRLDDLHWADPASVELIGHLLRHPPEGRVLLAMALRPAQAPDRLRSALAAAELDRSGTRLPLDPLSPADADVLLDGVDDPAARAALYRDAGGIPFYVSFSALKRAELAARRPTGCWIYRRVQSPDQVGQAAGADDCRPAAGTTTEAVLGAPARLLGARVGLRRRHCLIGK